MDIAVAALVALFAVSGVTAGCGARALIGRLRRGARIRAGWCEAAVAVLWSVTGAGWVFEAWPGRWVPVLLGLGWLAVAAGAVDVRHRRLPDALTVPAVPLGLLLLIPLGWSVVLRGIAGAALAAAAYGAVHALNPHALGAGDVKLAGSLGAVLAAGSWPAVLLAAVLAAAITAVLAVISSVATASRSAGRARCPPDRSARSPSPPNPAPDRPRSARRPNSEPDRPRSARRLNRVPRRPRRVPHVSAGVPHGPSMLAAAWLVTTGLAAGAPLGTGGGG
jgi:leader peptidase (prepilin peptidase) / N-methyltransferase